MPTKRPSVKNEKQSRGAQGQGHVEGARGEDRQLAGSVQPRRQEVWLGGDSRQGGTTAQKKAAGRKGGKATARKSS